MRHNYKGSTYSIVKLDKGYYFSVDQKGVSISGKRPSKSEAVKAAKSYIDNNS